MSDLIYIGLTVDEIKALLHYLNYSENNDAMALYDKLIKEIE